MDASWSKDFIFIIILLWIFILYVSCDAREDSLGGEFYFYPENKIFFLFLYLEITR